MWVTTGDVYKHFGAFKSPEAKKWADKVLATSKKTAPNPMAPKDKEMRLHRLLKSMIEGKRTSVNDESGTEISGRVEEGNKDAGAAVVANLETGRKKFGTMALANECTDEEGDDDEKKAKEKQAKKEEAARKKAEKLAEQAKKAGEQGIAPGTPNPKKKAKAQSKYEPHTLAAQDVQALVIATKQAITKVASSTRPPHQKEQMTKALNQQVGDLEEYTEALIDADSEEKLGAVKSKYQDAEQAAICEIDWVNARLSIGEPVKEEAKKKTAQKASK